MGAGVVAVEYCRCSTAVDFVSCQKKNALSPTTFLFFLLLLFLFLFEAAGYVRGLSPRAFLLGGFLLLGGPPVNLYNRFGGFTGGII